MCNIFKLKIKPLIVRWHRVKAAKIVGDSKPKRRGGCMSNTKTTYNNENVVEFVHSFAKGEQKKADSLRLMALMEEWSGFKARMWGPSIIGFGSYRYKYASGHEGEAPILGFSPRKAAFSLYIYSDTEKSRLVLSELGKFRMTKSCIYVNKLADIDIDVLKVLCLESMAYIGQHHECSCRTNH